MKKITTSAIKCLDPMRSQSKALWSRIGSQRGSQRGSPRPRREQNASRSCFIKSLNVKEGSALNGEGARFAKDRKRSRAAERSGPREGNSSRHMLPLWRLCKCINGPRYIRRDELMGDHTRSFQWTRRPLHAALLLRRYSFPP